MIYIDITQIKLIVTVVVVIKTGCWLFKEMTNKTLYFKNLEQLVTARSVH